MQNQKFTGHSLLWIIAVTALVGTGNVSMADTKDMVGTEIYTLTNLHPDEENKRLYSTNYNLPSKINVCTKVKILKISHKKMKFEVVDRGREYDYLFHSKSTPEGFEENIKKYFGPECPSAEIEKMSATDKKGIKSGRATIGMTRKGIIIAMGYPPEHVTPDLDHYEWMYWMNKFNRDAIVFGEDGKVSEVRK